MKQFVITVIAIIVSLLIFANCGKIVRGKITIHPGDESIESSTYYLNQHEVDSMWKEAILGSQD